EYPQIHTVPAPEADLIFQNCLPLYLPSLTPAVSVQCLSPILFNTLDKRIHCIVSWNYRNAEAGYICTILQIYFYDITNHIFCQIEKFFYSIKKLILLLCN
ncbi:MAG: hypothetical protein KA936_06325, partial [Blautia sp.]|nr:hypothetical protein [Blautia sp.]